MHMHRAANHSWKWNEQPGQNSDASNQKRSEENKVLPMVVRPGHMYSFLSEVNL